MSAPQSSEDRIVALELLVTHLERDQSTLNTSLLAQQKEIETLKRALARLDDRVLRLAEGDEPRSPEAERPPHY